MRGGYKKMFVGGGCDPQNDYEQGPVYIYLHSSDRPPSFMDQTNEEFVDRIYSLLCNG